MREQCLKPKQKSFIALKSFMITTLVLIPGRPSLQPQSHIAPFIIWGNPPPRPFIRHFEVCREVWLHQLSHRPYLKIRQFLSINTDNGSCMWVIPRVYLTSIFSLNQLIFNKVRENPSQGSPWPLYISSFYIFSIRISHGDLVASRGQSSVGAKVCAEWKISYGFFSFKKSLWG